MKLLLCRARLSSVHHAGGWHQAQEYPLQCRYLHRPGVSVWLEEQIRQNSEVKEKYLEMKAAAGTIKEVMLKVVKSQFVILTDKSSS